MRKAMVALGLSILALTCSGAAAQVSENDARTDVEEIIIEGTKIGQSITEVTASVDVITAEEILREPIVDLYDIVNRIPNVTPSFGGLGFSIRGVDQRGIAGSGATLTTYVDDSPLGNFTTFFGPLDSWDLAQVEVYRGPQSTNFGRNTLAGAIYVRTQDPSYEWDLRARGEVGNNGVLQGAIAGGGPIIEDKLAFRVAGNYRESDGFIFNSFLEERADATELKTGRFKLLFEPSETVSIISTTSYTENFAGEDNVNPTNGVPGAIISADEVVREVAYDTPGREGTETLIQSINATWSISDQWEIQSIFTYQSTDYVRQEDFDLTPAPIAALDRTGGDEVFSEELRIKYLGERFQGVLGFYFFDNEDFFQDQFSVPATALNPALPGTVFISRVSTTTNSTTNYAGFFDGEYALSDSFDLLFGFRYDREEQDSQQEAVTAIANPPLPPGLEFLNDLTGTNVQTTGANYDAFLPKFGVRWSARENVVLSFVVQRAYRAGGAVINFASGGLEEFEPEYLWNYELAARTNFLDGRLLWNTNIYYSDWSDQQVTEPLPPPFQTFTRTVNAGQSVLYGLETDIIFQATDELEFYGGLGFSVAEFRDFPNGNFDPDAPEGPTNQANFDGNRFPFAPRWSLNAGVDYQHPTGVFGGFDLNYQTNIFQLNENLPVNEFGERVLVNARLGYKVTEHITATAYVRNLFEEQFYTSLNRTAPGAEFARLGAKRTWAIRLDFAL